MDKDGYGRVCDSLWSTSATLARSAIAPTFRFYAGAAGPLPARLASFVAPAPARLRPRALAKRAGAIEARPALTAPSAPAPVPPHTELQKQDVPEKQEESKLETHDAQHDWYAVDSSTLVPPDLFETLLRLGRETRAGGQHVLNGEEGRCPPGSSSLIRRDLCVTS